MHARTSQGAPRSTLVDQPGPSWGWIHHRRGPQPQVLGSNPGRGARSASPWRAGRVREAPGCSREAAVMGRFCISATSRIRRKSSARGAFGPRPALSSLGRVLRCLPHSAPLATPGWSENAKFGGLDRRKPLVAVPIKKMLAIFWASKAASAKSCPPLDDRRPQGGPENATGRPLAPRLARKREKRYGVESSVALNRSWNFPGVRLCMNCQDGGSSPQRGPTAAVLAVPPGGGELSGLWPGQLPLVLLPAPWPAEPTISHTVDQEERR